LDYAFDAGTAEVLEGAEGVCLTGNIAQALSEYDGVLDSHGRALGGGR
jgi:hypothetical protein